MSLHRALAPVSSLILMLSLAGCAGKAAFPVSQPNTQPSNPVSGNWQVISSTGVTPLTQLSGSLNNQTTGVTGVLHADTKTGCATSTDPITVTGKTGADGVTTLTGRVAGGTLSISGTLSSDSRSLNDAIMNVTGGQCAFVAPVHAMVQNYSSVTGTYTGAFADADGLVMNVTANLTQSPDGDSTGNFTLNGTGSFGPNPCLVSPVNVVNSQVTGGNFTLTYTDSTTGNSVTATGTFSTDGSTLTVSNWSLTGSCGADQGTGTLTKQSTTSAVS